MRKPKKLHQNYINTSLMGALLLIIFLGVADADKLYPPWEQTKKSGVDFTVPEVNNAPDLSGAVNDPELVIFFGGNEFMVIPDLIEEFKAAYPQYKRIFYETLPPGIITRQLKEGNLIIGNLEISVKPDIIAAGENRIKKLQEQGSVSDPVPYLQNSLTLMVAKGNPKKIASVLDLGREDIKVSMPNAEIEDIAKKITELYEKAGGEKLVNGILKDKVQRGTTYITQIHHRQTPMRIMKGESDVGPVWLTEALFQEKIGNPIDLVKIPDELNQKSVSAAAKVVNAPHMQAATDFIEFMKGKKAQSILKEYGFEIPK
jgi:ABC-type molybdate transport system substrate-binding protein